MKLLPLVVMSVAATTAITFGQSAHNEPTRQEIAEAYRSKSGEGGIFIPAVRWERWRIRDVRGWSLRFKRVKESRNIGVLALEYTVREKGWVVRGIPGHRYGADPRKRSDPTCPGRRSRCCPRMPMNPAQHLAERTIGHSR
jgi:hypothetical protein